MGHLARDRWSSRRHMEGNVATVKEVKLSGCLSEESVMLRQEPQLKMIEVTLWKS